MNHNETHISSLCLGTKTREELDTKIKQETELKERGKNKYDFNADNTWKLGSCLLVGHLSQAPFTPPFQVGNHAPIQGRF